jgi:hypothetical protein
VVHTHERRGHATEGDEIALFRWAYRGQWMPRLSMLMDCIVGRGMKAISTRTIGKLAPPAKLLLLGQSVAMLDAVLFPDDWEARYHSFASDWAPGEQVFSMRNHSGDFYFIWFVHGGAVLQGFAHESAMSPWSSQRSKKPDAGQPYSGLFDGFPKSFDYASYLKTRAAFCEDEAEVTFCAWCTPKDEWRIGDVTFPKGADPDGSSDLLFVLDGKPETYAKWAKSYIERSVPLAAIEQVYARAPLTEAMVAAVNREANLGKVMEEAKAIGYPVERGKRR